MKEWTANNKRAGIREYLRSCPEPQAAFRRLTGLYIPRRLWRSPTRETCERKPRRSYFRNFHLGQGLE